MVTKSAGERRAAEGRSMSAWSHAFCETLSEHNGTNGEAVCKWFGHGHNVWVTIDGETRVGPHIASSEETTLNEFKDQIHGLILQVSCELT